MSDEVLRDLRGWNRLLAELSWHESIYWVLRAPQNPMSYRDLAYKAHLSVYFLFQIHDWLLIHQHELVKDILTPFHCPKCTYRIHPPEMLAEP
ncbi:hypothetical protein [Streptosporangium subroseum]|nr:hypothetical protein [Streptosporangium subroseum]